MLTIRSLRTLQCTILQAQRVHHVLDYFLPRILKLLERINMFSQLIAPCAMMPSSAACHRQIGRMLARQSRLSLGTVHSAPLRVRHCGARGGVVLAAAGLAEEIQKKNANNSVVVYSKTYCTSCR